MIQGQYQNANTQSGCKHCSAGQYNPHNLRTSCYPCTVGRYQNQNAQTSCKHCTSVSSNIVCKILINDKQLTSKQ